MSGVDLGFSRRLAGRGWVGMTIPARYGGHGRPALERYVVIVTRDGGVARVTLDNPRRKNAISLEMAAAIEAFCDQVETDASVGAVLGRGSRRLFLQLGRYSHPGRVLGRSG